MQQPYYSGGAGNAGPPSYAVPQQQPPFQPYATQSYGGYTYGQPPAVPEYGAAPRHEYPPQQVASWPGAATAASDVASLRAEMMQALAFARVDAGELVLPVRLLGDPRNNNEVAWQQAVTFAQPFVAPPRVVLHLGSVYAQGSGEHGAAPTVHGNLDRLLVKMSALDVTPAGFTFDVRTWHRGHLMEGTTFVWAASCSPTWGAGPPAAAAAAGTGAALVSPQPQPPALCSVM